jgi:endonuclease YncB( thermonuclease family)
VRPVGTDRPVTAETPIVSPVRQVLCVIVLLVHTGLAGAADYQLPGRVLRVIDGDSLVLDVRGGIYQVELTGIDAPEPDQPWGEAAAYRLNATLTGVFVVVDARASAAVPHGIVYGSVVFKGRDVALDMLHDGLAWSTIPVDPQQTSPHPYNEAQRQAQDAHRGLWSDPDPIPPWEWRAGRARAGD